LQTHYKQIAILPARFFSSFLEYAGRTKQKKLNFRFHILFGPPERERRIICSFSQALRTKLLNFAKHIVLLFDVTHITG